jgi:hypothetical protein
MDETETQQAIELIKDVISQNRKGELRSESAMCKALKASLDSQMGPQAWHVVIGEQFGSFVTHESCKIIYIHFQRQMVLCWAHG